MPSRPGADTYGLLADNVTPDVRQPKAPAEESAGPPLTDLVLEYQRSVQAMHTLYRRMSRSWTRLRQFQNVDADGSGNAVVTFDRLTLGWEAEITRIIVVVAGASHAATLAVYRGGVSDNALLDFQTTLLGDSPSRRAVSYLPPIELAGQENIVLNVLGAVASQKINAHIEGRMREL